jgi:hypothetical protein
MSAAFDLPSLNSASSFFLLIFARLVTEWLNTDLAQGLRQLSIMARKALLLARSPRNVRSSLSSTL